MTDATISNCLPNATKECVNDPEFWVASHHEASTINLGYRVDTYGGVIFDGSDLPHELMAFRELFISSLRHVVSAGYNKAYWISVPSGRCDLVPVIMNEFGFYVHHAKREYFMLAKWNDVSRPNPIPIPSMHQVCYPFTLSFHSPSGWSRLCHFKSR